MSGKFFSAEAAIPGAVAAVWHNIAGAIFAAVARKSAERTARAEAQSEVGTEAGNPAR